MEESRKQRDEFEKWWGDEGWDKRLSNVQGMMFNRIKTGMFTAWQASREAIEIELPKPHAHLIWIQAGHAPDDYWDDVVVSYSEKDKCCDGSERYPVHAGWEIEDALRAAGIKVKE